MDRRQRKTREAIFGAFSQLLAQKSFSRITVNEILELADVGRATFYAHFETKDYLLKAFCDELFCHIFDSTDREAQHHDHIFKCSGSDSAIVHLFQHLKNNDNNILALLSSQNCTLFLPYFRNGLEELLEGQTDIAEDRKKNGIPQGFWKNHIVSVLMETVLWWVENGMVEAPQTVADYYMQVV